MEQVALKFRLTPDADASLLRAWATLLHDPALLTVQGLVEPEPPEAESAEAWLHSILVLAVGLMQALRFPIFKIPAVLECRPLGIDRVWWVARFDPPDLGVIAPHLFERLLKISFLLAGQLAQGNPEEPVDRARFFGLIDQQILVPLGGEMVFGKSTFEVARIARIESVPYFPLPGGALQLGCGVNSRFIERSTTDRDSVLGMHWSHNKFLAAQMLRLEGLPAPAHVRVTSLAAAENAVRELGYPVVIKPADLDRGEGVSIDVGPGEIEVAFERALSQSRQQYVLVEQQVPGICHRLFVSSGVLLYAVKRQPLGVYGDGVLSVRHLVDQEFAKQQAIVPWRRSKMQPLDALALKMLSIQGLSPTAIPREGQFVALRRIESTALGGVSEDVTDQVHPENAQAAIAAARLFGLEVAGVDIISTDISQSWRDNAAVINEVNYAPLMGTGEVSRRYMSSYLSRVVPKGGGIPIYAFEGGGEIARRARRRWTKLRQGGLATYFADDEKVLDPRGNVFPIAAKDVGGRTRSLLMRKHVEALVLYSSKFACRGLMKDLGVDLVE